MSIADCATLVEKGDPDRFAAVMAAPVAARAVLLPIYAFNLELARAPFAAREPMIAEMRLQWWADLLDEAEAGKIRKHEVAEPLAALVAEGLLPVAVLRQVVEARRRDCWREAFADAAALSDYLEGTGAALMWATAAALGAGPEAEKAARGLGWASAAAGFLRAVPELAARDLPGVPGGDHAGLAQAGLARLAVARAAQAGLGAQDRAAGRAALLAGWQAGPILSLAAAEPARIEAGALQLSEFSRRGRLLWQATTGRW